MDRNLPCINAKIVKGRFQNDVILEFEGGETEKAFSYYADELFFSEREFVGLSLRQANELFTKKDIAYLRS